MADSRVSPAMPKNTVRVISAPETRISRLTSSPVALATGMANIATPTPNQPTWVPPSSAEGSQEPLLPNE